MDKENFTYFDDKRSCTYHRTGYLLEMEYYEIFNNLIKLYFHDTNERHRYEMIFFCLGYL